MKALKIIFPLLLCLFLVIGFVCSDDGETISPGNPTPTEISTPNPTQIILPTPAPTVNPENNGWDDGLWDQTKWGN